MCLLVDPQLTMPVMSDPRQLALGEGIFCFLWSGLYPTHPINTYQHTWWLWGLIWLAAVGHSETVGRRLTSLINTRRLSTAQLTSVHCLLELLTTVLLMPPLLTTHSLTSVCVFCPAYQDGCSQSLSNRPWVRRGRWGVREIMVLDDSLIHSHSVRKSISWVARVQQGLIQCWVSLLQMSSS